MLEVELLKAAARQRLAAGQGELDLGLEPAAAGNGGGPLPITSSRMGHLLDALTHAYRVLGLEDAAGGDEVFLQLVLARIIEPVSKLDSPAGAGGSRLAAASYRTVERRLRVYARKRGGRSCPRRARRMPGWARRAWCSTTSAPCTSRPTPGTGSGERVLQGTAPGTADHHRAAR